MAWHNLGMQACNSMARPLYQQFLQSMHYQIGMLNSTRDLHSWSHFMVRLLCATVQEILRESNVVPTRQRPFE